MDATGRSPGDSLLGLMLPFSLGSQQPRMSPFGVKAWNSFRILDLRVPTFPMYTLFLCQKKARKKCQGGAACEIFWMNSSASLSPTTLYLTSLFQSGTTLVPGPSNNSAFSCTVYLRASAALFEVTFLYCPAALSLCCRGWVNFWSVRCFKLLWSVLIINVPP